MIENWKTKLNMGHKVGVIYMDLSKAFDSLNYELLIPKVKCYGLDKHAVESFRNYLLNWFYDNYMVLNSGKSHFMLFESKRMNNLT